MYTLSSSILTLLNMIVWNRGVSPYGRVIDGVFLYEDSMPFWQILILSKFATKSLSPIASRHDFLIALRFIRMNKRSLPLRGQYTFSFWLIPKNEKLFASLTQAKQFACYPAQKQNSPNRGYFVFVRDKGVEPFTTVWKTVIIPIN